MILKTRMNWLGLGVLWALASGMPAVADDTELFIGNSLSSTAQPNILFIVDNSGSMGSLVLTQAGYDGTITYPAAGCDATRVYWRTGTGNPPACTTNNYFNAPALRCDRAAQAFLTAGYYTDNMAQYDPSNTGGGRRWETIAAAEKNRVVECQDDRGTHGNNATPPNLYARNNQAGVPGYWGTAGQEIAWGATPANETYTIYSGNYLNWAYGPTGLQTRLEIVQDVATALLDSINGVNVGLMTFNRNSDNTNDGGHVVYPIEDITTARAPIQSAVNGLAPTGFTPLSETLYEAAMYYSGGAVTFGEPDSVAGSRDPSDSSEYQSPFAYDCQRNFIVYLTDGEPTRDDAADSAIQSMTDDNGDSFSSLVGGSCDAETYPAGFNPSGGECLDDLAEFLYEGDFSALSTQQNVSTYTVGFTIDLPILAETAARGGGRYYTADDTATLATALTNIVTSILSEDTTFTAPTVAVNTFNRTQNLSDLFISVFRPSGRTHWPGNLKKYRVRAADATILDANGAPAIDPATGFFSDTAQSFWSAAVDGPVADAGGSADLIPGFTNRVVYTYLSGTNLTATANRVSLSNSALTDAVLNTGGAGDPTRDNVIDFINGIDVPDTDQDGDTTEARTQMGDPLHSQPASVVYGPGLRDGLVFMATNDGYLHAIDLESGVEQWAFIPPEFLADQVDLFRDESNASKQYGIDSDLRIQVVADSDTTIEPGEKVYLFFGMGRGGDSYYGLDVSNRLSPQLLWRLDGTNLPGVGQSWSPPMPTRVNVAGVSNPDNPDHLAVVLGGGYEPDQDNSALTTDTIGNSIYIVDSEDGTLLWHGSRDGLHKDFNVSGRAMDYSIPARIRTVDVDGDGYLDRMYAGDMGGQVWRFDVTNGQSAANLVVGGVIAQLGGAPAAAPAPEDVRRFYNAPDVAFINARDRTFIHVGIGSGHRGHPLSTSVEDAFYALRDGAMGRLTQAEYDALALIEHDDLVPITSASTIVPSAALGWRVDLSIGGWNGEKVLSEGRTFANQVFFSSFQPSTGALTCQPQLGTNRTYIMSVYDGSPVMNLDGSADPDNLTMADLFVEAEGGILPAAQALFVDQDSDADGIPDIEDDSDGDGLADANDADDDGDGVADDMEDGDGDGIPNLSDGDDDGDGMPDDVDNDDTRANAGEDPDGDGVPNYLDDDDDGDGRRDSDDDDDDVVFVGRQGFTGVMTNNPRRTFWSQESVD